MSIERQEIEKLATLSRIAIGEDTITEVSQRLSSVLELVDQLQAVDTERRRGHVAPHASHSAPA